MPTDFHGGGRAPHRRQRGALSVLNEPARPDFTLTHHPARWQEMDGELLPLLGRMSHARGVNNVDHFGDTTRAEVNLSKKGWTLIPPEACPAAVSPDGIPGYVRVFDGRVGPIHVTAWERPRALGSRVVWDRDEQGYRQWLRHLMTEGFIAPPDSTVVDYLREQLMSKRERKAAAADLNPYARQAVEQIDKALERLDAAWAKVSGTDEADQAEPAPKARTRRGAK